MFRELFPILTTPDLPRALGFYRDLLGAEVTYEFSTADGPPAYVGLRLGDSQLGIGQALEGEDVAPTGPISLWLYADDCDAAVERLRSAGVRVLQEPADQPWGERVARVADPDGNEVLIGAR
jgi:lactoylglutathione lyase